MPEPTAAAKVMDDAELTHQLRNPHGHSQIIMRLAAADRIEAITARLAVAEKLAEGARGFLKGADAGIVSVAQDKALRAALAEWEAQNG